MPTAVIPPPGRPPDRLERQDRNPTWQGAAFSFESRPEAPHYYFMSEWKKISDEKRNLKNTERYFGSRDSDGAR